ncbi:MAG TPA: hypothetical protein VFQ25_16410 [Ktedonobacterales bacterium]|nr:hypothetical protein [Ktedonobacterales bacterium]
MSEPSPPPIRMERYYHLESEYIADVASMEAAGWRLVAAQRAPDNTIVATYAYALTPSPPPMSPLGTLPPPYALAAPAPQLRYIPIIFAAGLGLPILVILLCVSVLIMNATFGALGSLPACMTDSASCAAFGATQSPACAATPAITATETSAARPTATTFAADLTGATLGGPLDAFTALFGCEAPSGAWYDVNFHGQILYVEIGYNQSADLTDVQSSDGLDRVSSIAVYWFHSPLPSLATMRATTALFFPPHSISHGANTKVSPTEYLYRSAPLAAMFGSDAFVNDAGEPVAPGTFSEVCDGASCTLQIGDWNEGA